MKYTEAILSNSTRKLLWLEFTKMLIAVKKEIYGFIHYNLWHTFVPRLSAEVPTELSTHDIICTHDRQHMSILFTASSFISLFCLVF